MKLHSISRAFPKIKLEPFASEMAGLESDGQRAFGLFIDRVKQSEQEPDGYRYDHPTVHVVLSKLPPELWLTSFTMEIMLERKVGRSSYDRPMSNDSVHGLVHALSEAGVNLLEMETSQFGYDLCMVRALCDLPSLRQFSMSLCEEVDAAIARLRVPNRPGDPDRAIPQAHDATLHRSINTIRVHAMRRLGRVLLPLLANLEARLLVADDLRFGQWGCPDPSRLPKPWFLNSRVVEAGDNPYFMESLDFGTLDSIEGAFDVLPRHLSGSASRPRLPEGFRAAFDRAVEVLRQRTLTGTLRDFLKEPEAAIKARKVRFPESMVTLVTRFFRRQSIRPIKIRSMPNLAHARLNAMSPVPLLFTYSHAKGELMLDNAEQATLLKETLDHASHPYADSLGRPITHDESTQVMVNVNPLQRFLRLRFVRGPRMRVAFGKVRVDYEIEHPGNGVVLADGVGVTEAILAGVASQEFRIEHARVRCHNVTRKAETGSIELIVKCLKATEARAVTERSESICTAVGRSVEDRMREQRCRVSTRCFVSEVGDG